MHGMFYGDRSLTELDLSHFDTSNVTDMHSMFMYCSSLTELDLSHFDTSNVTTMYRMFNGCSSLTELDLSNFDTSNVTDIALMFNNCKNLKTTFTIHGNPTTYDNAFSGAATATGSGITVNYSRNTTNIDNIIATKSANSNVVKGNRID